MRLKNKQKGYINLDGIGAIFYMALFGLICAALLAIGGVSALIYAVAKIFF